MSRVAVVIPTWNGRELLDGALASLARQSLPAAEVIVVDNGSTDGTTAHVRERWPEVSLVVLEGTGGSPLPSMRGWPHRRPSTWRC